MTATDTTLEVASLLEQTSAVLLDFNGTLSDDEGLCAEIIADIAAEEIGVPLTRERYFVDFVGQTEESIFRRLAEEAGVADSVDAAGALVAKFNRDYLDRVRSDRRVSSEAEAFVREASRQGKAIAVVTVATKDVVVPVLNQLDLLDLVDVVVALEDVVRPKPEPDCYLRTLELLGIQPEDALVFEDSPTGLSAARSAGVVAVAVGDGIPAAERASFTPYAVPELHPDLLKR